MLTTSATDTGQRWSDWLASRFESKQSQPRPRTQALSGIAGTTTHALAADTAAISRPVTFIEPAESFLNQALRGFGLSVLTLGIYSFWARADARRQLYRSIHIDGEPLDYTGSGREGLISFVMGAAVTVVLVSLFLHFFMQTGVTGQQLGAAMSDFRVRRLTISLPMLFLLGSVAYRRRKHVLRRTWWRGERFDLDGQPWAYATQHFWTAFLVPLTLGWAAPWRACHLENHKTREMHLGVRRFSATGSPAPLYRAFAMLWFGGGTIYAATLVMLGVLIGEPLLAAVHGATLKPLLDPVIMETGVSVLAIGLIPVIGTLLYYRAAWIEHQISSLVFDGTQLQIALPRARFAALLMGCSVMKLASLGALTPVADAAVARFLVVRLTAVKAAG